MKSKEIMALALFGVVLAVVAILVLSRSGGQSKHSATVEVIAPITPEFSQEAREILLGKDPKQPVTDFLPPIDVKQGLGNSSPFTPRD